jgi:hypothetical protein
MSPDAPVIGRRPRRRPSNVETPDPFPLPLDTPPMEAALAGPEGRLKQVA